MTFRAVRYLTGFIILLFGGTAPAIQFTNNYTYNGTNYANYLWWDTAITNIQGVIVHMNYAAGAGLYSNTNWQNFAKARNLAMMLSANQDNLLSAADGVKVASNTLVAIAAPSGHGELTNWQPFIFCGLSRGGGGANGGIAQGWAAGRNRTLACVAYHGNSLVTTLYANTTDAKSIPVLYTIGSFDAAPVQPAPDTRQGDIEDWVRLGANYGYSIRANDGGLWTTTLQYGIAHNNTGNDTYILQWLGRVIDARLDNNNRGSLKPIVTTNCHGINYTMGGVNMTNCVFTNISVATTFLVTNKMIWLPPGGDAEWLYENTTPRLAGPTNNLPVIYAGQTNSLAAAATDPNGEPLRYQWSLLSAPTGGYAFFGNPTNLNTTVRVGSAPGNYVLQLVVTDPGISVSGTVSVAVSPPPILDVRISPGGQFVIGGTNGIAGTNFLVLFATNLLLPAPNWTVLATNQFRAGGAVNFTNPLDSASPQMFFRLRLP